MPSISICPRCQREITIPTLAAYGSHLRCRVCSGEFLGAEVLARSAACPPEAVLIEADLPAGDAPLLSATGLPASQPGRGDVGLGESTSPGPYGSAGPALTPAALNAVAEAYPVDSPAYGALPLRDAPLDPAASLA